MLTTPASARQVNVLKPGDSVPTQMVSVWEKGRLINKHWDPSADSLVILDFWATWCTACIDGIATLDSLQRQFGERIKVWLVNTATTGDDTAKFNAYYKRWAKKTGNDLLLPSIINDVSLSAMFPHNEIPHLVWIYKGMFLTLSDKASLNSSVVTRLINEGQYHGYSKPQPVLFTTTDRLRRIMFEKDGEGFSYSLLTGRNEQLPALVLREWKRPPQYSTATMLNQSLLDLARYAYMPELPGNRVRVLAKPVENSKKLASRLNELFCYEFRDTVSSRRKLQQYLARDLERRFEFRARLVSKRDRCIYLKKIEQTSFRKSVHVVDSMSVAELVLRLNVMSSVPVLISPRLSEKQHVWIKGWPGNETEIFSFLKAHGIDIRIKKRPVKLLLLEAN